MRVAGVFLVSLVCLCLAISANATIDISERYPGDPFSTIDSGTCGRTKLIASSTGLWAEKCATSINGVFNIGWTSNGATATTTIVKAFLFWQVSTTASTAQTAVGITSLDGKSVAVTSRVTMRKGCELTETILKYDNNFLNDRPLSAYNGVYADVTSIASTWAPGPVASFSKSFTFTGPCSPKSVLQASSATGFRTDGASLFLVLSDSSFSPSSYSVQFGSLSGWYNTPAITDSSILSNLLTYDFTSSFTIPPIGTTPTSRGAGPVSLTYAVGDGGDGSTCELGLCLTGLQGNPQGTGIDVNGVPFTRTVGGAGNAQMNAFREDISSAVTATTGTINVKPLSFAECLTYLAMAVEYPCNSQSGESGLDPHIRSFDGVWTTVFAEGDFAMVESASTGLVVHARFAKNVRGAWAPWTTHLLTRCGTKGATVEIYAGKSFAQPLIKGTTDVPLVSVVNPTTIVVECAQQLSMRVWLHRMHRFGYINVDYKPLDGRPADLKGLLGTPNGNATDDVQSRDGWSWVAALQQPHHIGMFTEELNAVHESWRVAESQRLFRTALKFDPSHALADARSRVAAHPDEIAKAKAACAKEGISGEVALAVCVHDVVVLGTTASIHSIAHMFDKLS
mmetsp:Transcript_27029/g.46585  ORF Transcript_27029/g.46585 Transcript_27029/m.46585 type:complete len:623 (+) Transcript_27029:165-2033(+)